MASLDQEQLESEHNIHFAETKVVGQVESQISKVPITQLDALNIPSSPTDLEVFGNRYFLIKEGLWGTEADGVALATFAVNKDLLTLENYVRRLLSIHTFSRFNFKVRLQINSTKFHVGRLIMWYKPFNIRNNYSSSGGGGPVLSTTGFPHVIVDAASSNVGELNVSWPFFVSSFRNDMTETWGSFVLSVGSKLQFSTGATTSVGYSMWMALPQLKMAIPRNTISWTTASPVEQAECQMFSALGKSIDAVTKPIQDIVVPVVSMVSSLADNALVVEGSDLRERMSNLSISTGPVQGLRLSLNPASNLEYFVDDAIEGNDEMNLLYLMSVPMVCATFEMVTTYVPVMPTYGLPIVNATGTPALYSSPGYYSTHLSYYSSRFLRWRGSIRYRLDFITSMFTTGRISCTFVPAIITSWTDEYLMCPTIICDLHEKRTFSFEIPYASNYFYSEIITNLWNVNATTGTSSGRWNSDQATGTLVIRVLNELNYPSNVPNSCVVWLWISAGKDFEVAVLRDYASKEKYAPYVATVERAECQMMQDVEQRDENLENEYPLLFPAEQNQMNVRMFSEDFSHLKKILGRFTLIYSGECAVSTVTRFLLPSQPIISSRYVNLLTPPTDNASLLNFFSQPFVFYRGGIRYFVQTDATSINKGFCYASLIEKANVTSVVMDTDVNMIQPSGSLGAASINLADKASFVIEVPYYMRTVRFPTASGDMASRMGLCLDFVLNRYSNVAQFNPLPVKVKIFVAAADDFRLMFPVAPPPIWVNDETNGPIEEVQTDMVRIEKAECQMAVIERAECQMNVKNLIVGTGLVLTAGLLGYGVYRSAKQCRKVIQQFSGFGKMAAMFTGHLDLILGDMKIESVKSSVFKCLLNVIEFLRIRDFMDFCIWFARLVVDIPIFSIIKKELWWQTLEVLENAKVEKAECQMGGFTEGSVFCILLVALVGLCNYGDVRSIRFDGKFFNDSVVRIRNLMSMLSSVGNFEQAYPKCKRLVERVSMMAFGSCSEDARNELELDDKFEEMKTWMVDVLKLYNSDEKEKIATSKTQRLLISTLWERGLEYMALVNKVTRSMADHANFKYCFTKISELNDIAMNSKMNIGFKYEPFCICIVGSAGIGKTFCVREIARILLAQQGLKGLENVYCRSGEDPYWSKYAGQNIVIYDDFGKSDPALTSVDVFNEFMSAKSSEVYSLNMADVSEKGKMFSSKIILQTTNDAFFKPKTLNCHLALWRRRDLLFEAKSTRGMMNMSSGPINFDHLQLRKLDPLNNHQPGEWMSFDNACKVMKDGFCRWQIKERNKQLFFEREDDVKPSTSAPILASVQDVVQTPKIEVAQCQMNTTEVCKKHGVTVMLPKKYLDAIYMEDGELKFDRIPEGFKEVEVSDEEMEKLLKNHVAQRQVVEEEKKSFMLRLWDSVKSQSSLMKMVYAFTLAVGVGLTAYSLGGFGKKDVAEQISQVVEVEMQSDSPTRDSRKIQAMKPRVVVGFPQMGERYDDPFADNLIKAMAKNVVTLVSHQFTVNGIGIKGRHLLIPHHFVSVLKNNDIIIVRSPVREDFQIKFNSRFVRFVSSADWCIYEMDKRAAMFKDILNYFVDEDDINKLESVPAGLVVFNDGVVSNILSVAERIGIGDAFQCSYQAPQKEFIIAQGWKYNIATSKGTCGSILVAYNRFIKGRILGLHLAGKPDCGRGWSTILTKEMITQALGDSHFISCEDFPVDQAEVQFGLTGDFTILGERNGEVVFLPRNSALVKTGCFGILGPPEKEPAILSVNDDRNVSHISPLRKSIEAFGEQTLPFDWDCYESAIRATYREMDKVFFVEGEEYKKNILTISEAVKGVHDDWVIQSVDRTSSMGYPYVLKGIKRKHVVDDLYNLHDKKIINNIEELERKCLRGEKPNVVWIDCLKDEKTTPEKVQEVKTRLFSVAPFDFLVVFKMYFGRFAYYWMKNFGKFFSCVGMNCESLDWQNLYFKLAGFSPLVFPYDFRRFDKLIDPNLFSDFVNYVNRWYDDEFSLLREILIECVIHRICLAIALFYIVHRGEPSGLYITIIFNCFVDAFYNRYNLAHIRKKKGFQATCDDFGEIMLDVNLGDDGVNSVKRFFFDHFTIDDWVQGFADYGLVATSSEKDQVIRAMHIDECVFLKRRFVRKEGLIVPQLNLSSIKEMFNWRRKELTEAVAIRDNFEMMQILLCSYPEEVYEELCGKIYSYLCKLPGAHRVNYRECRVLFDWYYRM